LQKKAVEIAKIQKSADADTELAVEKFEAELAKARCRRIHIASSRLPKVRTVSICCLVDILQPYSVDKSGCFSFLQSAKGDDRNTV
jgi:hypothetical protein